MSRIGDDAQCDCDNCMTVLQQPPLHIPQEMASRHRARHPVIQIIKTATVPAAACKRESTTQFHDSKIKFPHPRILSRPSSAEFKTIFKAGRPNVAQWAN